MTHFLLVYMELFSTSLFELTYIAQLLDYFQSFYPGPTESSQESHNEQRTFPTRYWQLLGAICDLVM